MLLLTVISRGWAILQGLAHEGLPCILEARNPTPQRPPSLEENQDLKNKHPSSVLNPSHLRLTFSASTLAGFSPFSQAQGHERMCNGLNAFRLCIDFCALWGPFFYYSI